MKSLELVERYSAAFLEALVLISTVTYFKLMATVLNIYQVEL